MYPDATVPGTTWKINDASTSREGLVLTNEAARSSVTILEPVPIVHLNGTEGLDNEAIGKNHANKIEQKRIKSRAIMKKRYKKRSQRGVTRA